MSASSIDVVNLIENRRLSRYVLVVMLVALLSQILEGFDVVNLAFIAPVLVKQWRLEPAAMGPVFSAGLAGLVVGSVLFGTLGDRIGRKAAVIAAVVAFGICSLATTAVTNISQLFWLRFATGIGVGGVMPITMALTAEYAPGHMRARLTTIMSCGLTLGAALGGIAAVRVVPSLGWTSMFWIGGVGPFLILPLLLLFLPESIRFLVVRGGQDGRIAAILRRVDSRLTFAPETRFVLREATAKQSRMRDLFAAGWRIPTLLLWLTVFMNIVIASFYNQWTPTMLNSFGLTLGAAQSAAIMFQIGSIFGAFLLGWMADRVGFFWVLGISYLLSAMLSALAVSLGPSAALVLTIVFMQGLTGGAAQCCVNGLSGTFYPTAIRSTGSGWALAVGRCGGVLGPAIGGILMAAQWSIVGIFYVVSIPSFIACLSIITMGVAAARSGVAPQRVEPKEAAFS